MSIIYSPYITHEEIEVILNNIDGCFLGEGMTSTVYKISDTVVRKNLLNDYNSYEIEYNILLNLYGLDVKVPRPLAYDKENEFLYVEYVSGSIIGNYLKN